MFELPLKHIRVMDERDLERRQDVGWNQMPSVGTMVWSEAGSAFGPHSPGGRWQGRKEPMGFKNEPQPR